MSKKSWNITCGVSQLPIRPEDDIAIFLLVRNQMIKGDLVDHPTTGFYDADNLYQPLAPAIKGQYREYGRFQLLSSPLPIGAVKKRIRDYLSYSTEDVNMNTIQNHLDEVNSYEQLLNKISAGHLPGITFMPIHQELYDQMIYIGAFKDQSVNRKEMLLCEMTKFMLTDLEKDKEHDDDSPIIKQIKRHRVMSPLINGLNLIGNSQLTNDFVDFFLIHEVLNANRKLWQPQAGIGGVEAEYELSIEIGKLATKKYIEHLKEN